MGVEDISIIKENLDILYIKMTNNDDNKTNKLFKKALNQELTDDEMKIEIVKGELEDMEREKEKNQNVNTKKNRM